MKLNSQLAWTDYLKAQYLHMRPGTLGGVLRYVFLGFIVLIAIAGMAPVIAAGGWSESWPFFIPIFLLLVLIPLYFYVFLPRRVRHLFDQNKELGAPIEHEITPEGLTTTSQYGNSSRPWSIFRKWKENKDLLVLYITDIQFIMIPKRFCTPEQLTALHGYLDQAKVLEARKVKTDSWARTAIWIVLFIAVAVAFYLGFRNPTP
jgi:hypothetical protein